MKADSEGNGSVRPPQLTVTGQHLSQGCGSGARSLLHQAGMWSLRNNYIRPLCQPAEVTSDLHLIKAAATWKPKSRVEPLPRNSAGIASRIAAPREIPPRFYSQRKWSKQTELCPAGLQQRVALMLIKAHGWV